MQTPENTIEDAMVVFRGSAASPVVARRREEVCDALPVGIGKFMTMAHGRPAEANLPLRQVGSAVM
jgi:hypothetical protein